MDVTHHFTGRIPIKSIFTFNNGWERFKKDFSQYLTPHKIKVVELMLICGTYKLGTHVFKCPQHQNVLSFIPHSCKSKLCSSCGTVANQRWLASLEEYLLPSDYKHLNFTVPHQFRPFIRKNQKLVVSFILKAANHAIMSYCKEKGFIPGMISVVQTLSKRYNYHIHVHVIVTAGGLSLDLSTWISESFISYKAMEERFKFKFIELMRKAIGNDSVIYPKHYDQKRMLDICRTTASFFWNNDVGDAIDNPLIVFCYLGRYLKKCIIAESRILSFDGETISLMLPEYPSGTMVKTDFSQMEFIKLIVQHIPDWHSKTISYSGIYANIKKKELMPKANFLLAMLNPSRAYSTENILKGGLPVVQSWRERITKYKNQDPLTCPICKKEMVLSQVVFAHDTDAPAIIENLINNPKNIIVHNPFIDKTKQSQPNKYQQLQQRKRDKLWHDLKAGSIRN
ncbi:MAG: transposase [Candidatus Brocadiales bacterium]|nr:transposase [Candidatus Brocadiales bacterium]